MISSPNRINAAVCYHGDTEASSVKGLRTFMSFVPTNKGCKPE